ncbi:Gnt-I system high-affinity gluconate transporter [Chitinophaga costaii]|uniref:Gnt-I system high-affinity gluconate transporter n=1 Tax=Chitinophaga costaii TaxID=1335309 RepID=A0A1C4BS46_9BACT|nr:gluconate:H+ symporter [Chitinophaga costaii]PUZ27495.1 gluconate transporter [Chitinophaga costaii]SCC09726.1 Gnt-I system high-affinity gluconate transporter [Chitinophaga costaii]
MLLLIVIIGILALILLVTYAKLNTFLSFIIVAIGIGVAKGMPLDHITKAMQSGLGNIMGSLLVIIVLGSMLGKLVAESGAAQRISNGMLDLFGPKYVQWALMTTGLVVGIALFYGIGFVLMVPLIFTVAARTKMSTVFLGISLLAALSVTHGFLPPHPSPVALVDKYHAPMGPTLLYGLVLAIPSVIIAGPLFGGLFRRLKREPAQIFNLKSLPEEQLPSMRTSLFVALLPVVMLAIAAILKVCAAPGGMLFITADWVGNSSIVMLVSVLTAVWLLGLRRGMSMKVVMGKLDEAVKDIAGIVLVLAGSGMLTEILQASGISKYIGDELGGLSISPIVLGWTLAAIIRICIGSATIAGVTAAAIVAPMVASSGANPCLMVLATGAGSLMFSHVNDSGFWLFKEYFNLTVKETMLTWSLMETIVSVVGLLGALLLSLWF